VLRSEHVIARLSRGRLVPHRLAHDDPRALEVAQELCEVYAGHVGRPRARLEGDLAAREEELGPRLDARQGFRIVRGLSKLLEERAVWTSPTAADPYTLRTRVFELAATLPEPPAEEAGLLDAPTRDDVLSQVTAETGIEDPTALMYADRQGAQILEAFEEPLPEDLIARYNVAQVQGVLYAARDLVVDLGEGADARLVFHYVKLQGLIYSLEPIPRGYRLRLDGPLSIFGATRKYGLRLARFLPGLLLTSPWRLSATVEWRNREAYLELDSETSGLQSHYLGPRSEHEADPVREAFVRAWERAKDTGAWELEPGAGVLSFPERKAALVPDFTLRHTGTGERVHLEVLGFWSERNLVERAALLREAGERGHRVLVAVSERLGTSPEALSEAIKTGVISFKERLAPKAVLAALGEPGEASPGTDPI
jgi:predicted nuclease of restriction endonuclease-like RecB superfamily